MTDYDLIVAGAGPAGSACAITAARAGARVLMLEKDKLPRHKVCGEFVSSESLRLLGSLLSHDPFAEQPAIASARVFLDHKTISLPVSPSARSIPRFGLDAALVQSALRSGVTVQEGAAIRAVGRSEGADDEVFSVQAPGKTFTARAVVNATGRWSQLTEFSVPAQPRWIGLKAHYAEFSPPGSVDLYFFPGGYCGVQPVGKDSVNVAAMARADAARSMEEVFAAHPELWRRSRDWELLFPAMTTSPLYFRPPETEDRGMILVGDAAAFIDPFAGDGISLALHSGTLAAESLASFFKGECSLADSRRRYRVVYLKRLAPAFRNAARLRGLLSAPAWLRGTFLSLIGKNAIAQLVVQSTRAR